MNTLLAKFFLAIGILAIVSKNISYGNVFTSVMKMTKVPEIEKELIGFLEVYLQRAEKSETSNQLKEFLTEAKQANAVAVSEDKYVENPINSYKLLRRFAEGWSDVINKLTCLECEDAIFNSEFNQSVADFKTQMGVWPGKDDFFGATMALIRLTNTYKLPMDLLAKGIIYGTETVPLTAHEFSLIGDTARERDLMYESVLWYNQSAALLKMESTVDKTKTARAMKKLASSWFNYGMPSKALEVAEEALQYDSENRGLIRDLEFYRNSVKRMSENDRKKVFRRPPHPSFPYYQKYEGLCRGQIKSPREMAKLYCNYQSTSIPIYWTKVEYSNIDPPVVLFHDVISQSEIDWMIETATEQLSRSILGDVKNAGSMYSEARISENAWLADNYEMSVKLGKRISLITGLDASVRHWDTYAEPFQVLNYGLGGMYEPHHDFTKLYRDSGLEDNLLFKNSGDRVATWMFYLTDVKAGGATVFPTLKARVPAIKGAAAFWYNIKRSGVLDDRSLHAGCPLLLGTKWAANKWFRELGQAFRYGCTLDPSE